VGQTFLEVSRSWRTFVGKTGLGNKKCPSVCGDEARGRRVTVGREGSEQEETSRNQCCKAHKATKRTDKGLECLD